MASVNIGRFVPGLAALATAADLRRCGVSALVLSIVAKITVASSQ